MIRLGLGMMYVLGIFKGGGVACLGWVDSCLFWENGLDLQGVFGASHAPLVAIGMLFRPGLVASTSPDPPGAKSNPKDRTASRARREKGARTLPPSISWRKENRSEPGMLLVPRSTRWNCSSDRLIDPNKEVLTPCVSVQLLLGHGSGGPASVEPRAGRTRRCRKRAAAPAGAAAELPGGVF